MKIGLVLVHGIGEQKAGETAQKFIEGFKLVAPDATVRSDVSPKTIEVNDRTIVLYEAYWADLLLGERVTGTANIHYLLPLAWFPWLNRASPHFQADYSKARTLKWTAVLWLGAPALSLAWEVLGLIVTTWIE